MYDELDQILSSLPKGHQLDVLSFDKVRLHLPFLGDVLQKHPSIRIKHLEFVDVRHHTKDIGTDFYLPVFETFFIACWNLRIDYVDDIVLCELLRRPFRKITFGSGVFNENFVFFKKICKVLRNNSHLKKLIFDDRNCALSLKKIVPLIRDNHGLLSIKMLHQTFYSNKTWIAFCEALQTSRLKSLFIPSLGINFGQTLAFIKCVKSNSNLTELSIHIVWSDDDFKDFLDGMSLLLSRLKVLHLCLKDMSSVDNHSTQSKVDILVSHISNSVTLKELFLTFDYDTLLVGTDTLLKNGSLLKCSVRDRNWNVSYMSFSFVLFTYMG